MFFSEKPAEVEFKRPLHRIHGFVWS